MNSHFRWSMGRCESSWVDGAPFRTFHGTNATGLPEPSVDVFVRIGSVQSSKSSVTDRSAPLVMTTQDWDPSFANESIFTRDPRQLLSERHQRSLMDLPDSHDPPFGFSEARSSFRRGCFRHEIDAQSPCPTLTPAPRAASAEVAISQERRLSCSRPWTVRRPPRIQLA